MMKKRKLNEPGNTENTKSHLSRKFMHECDLEGRGDDSDHYTNRAKRTWG